mgnify:CR=1 FL=1
MTNDAASLIKRLNGQIILIKGNHDRFLHNAAAKKALATVVFLLAFLRDRSNLSTYWISFIAAVPFCGFVNFLYFKRLNNRIGRIISLSVVLCGVITTAALILFNYNSYAWMLFIIGAPIEAAINLYEFIRN